jgi:hypothetical protein
MQKRSNPQAAQGGKRRARSDPQGERQARCGRSSVERRAICDRCEERGEERGEIQRRRRGRKCSAWIVPQGAISPQGQNRSSTGRETSSTEQSARRAHGAVRKAKYRARSNPRMVRSAEVLSTAYAAVNAGTRCQPRSNPCIASGASVEQGAIPDRCKVRMVGTSNSGRKNYE